MLVTDLLESVQSLLDCHLLESGGIDEYDYIPSSPDHPFVLVTDANGGGEKLGLAYWLVEVLYPTVWKALREESTPHERLRLSRLGVLLSPESGSVWNYRKRDISYLLKESELRKDEMWISLVNRELRLTSIVLLKRAKSLEAWSHRVWLLRQVLLRDRRLARAYLLADLEFVLRLLDRHRRNYAAWSHRWWCIGRLLSEELAEIDAAMTFLLSELERLRAWAAARPSEHSAHHQLIQLMQQLWLLRPAAVLAEQHFRALLESEFRENLLQLRAYGGTFETLWLYRRSLLQLLSLLHEPLLRVIAQKRLVDEECSKIEALLALRRDNDTALVITRHYAFLASILASRDSLPAAMAARLCKSPSVCTSYHTSDSVTLLDKPLSN
jgi:hypothetical protein